MNILEFVSRGHEVIQQFVHVLLEPLFGHVFHCVKEHQPVLFINQSVVENTIHLMNPQTNQLVSLVQVRRWYEKHAKDYAREISQVEYVV